jgi:hypothetical protein
LAVRVKTPDLQRVIDGGTGAVAQRVVGSWCRGL